MDNSASGGVGGQRDQKLSYSPFHIFRPVAVSWTKVGKTTIGRTSIASDLLIARPEFRVVEKVKLEAQLLIKLPPPCSLKEKKNGDQLRVLSITWSGSI